jgi:hypothetical protein
LDKDGNAEFTGKVTATEGEFTGTVKANGGHIGGWYLVNNTLSSKENDSNGGSGVLLSPSGINYNMGDGTKSYVILAG